MGKTTFARLSIYLVISYLVIIYLYKWFLNVFIHGVLMFLKIIEALKSSVYIWDNNNMCITNYVIIFRQVHQYYHWSLLNIALIRQNYKFYVEKNIQPKM